MTSVEILGKVMTILRRCQECGKHKPLEHYFIYAGNATITQVIDSVKICAACRRHER